MKMAWLPVRLRETLQCSCARGPIASRQRGLNIGRRNFTSTTPRASIAAAPIRSFERKAGRSREEIEGEDQDEDTFYARVVPMSGSYFTSQPHFTDDLLHLESLLQRYDNLPKLKPGEVPRVAWRALSEYRDTVGEVVKASKYHKILRILHQLNHIHPSLMPAPVKQAIREYSKDINPFLNVIKPSHIDSKGRSLGAGRRKSATARAWLVEGTGEVLVNGKTLSEAFPRVHDRESVIWALKATQRIDKYNVWALAEGGGTTGQAEALTLAVGKALMAHEPALKPALRRAGCVTRDPRRVERKKPGHVKARKMPTWVKR